MITFEELCKIEPRPQELSDEISKVKDLGGPDGFSASLLWYTVHKPRVAALVGWEADDSRIATHEAYDVAYQHLYELLPDDRDGDFQP